MTADPRTLATKLRQDYASLRVSINGQGHLPVSSLADAADFIESVVPLHDAWENALPPCKTCGGTHIIKKKQSNGVRTEFGCSDCPDGVQSFAEWVAGLVADNERLTRLLGAKADRLDKLEVQLEEAQLRSIEARNPGIDMDEVKRLRQIGGIL